MAKVWQITGKKGLSGHRVSHANYKTHHVHQPNLKKKRVLVPEPNRYVTVKLSAKGLRILDKKGLYHALNEARLS